MDYSWCIRKGGSWETWKAVGCSWMLWVCHLAVKPQTVLSREMPGLFSKFSSLSILISSSLPRSLTTSTVYKFLQSHSSLSCSPFFLGGFWGMQTRFGAFSEAWLIVFYRILLPSFPVLNTEEVFLDPLELLFSLTMNFWIGNSCLRIFNPRECNSGHICSELCNVGVTSHTLFH